VDGSIRAASILGLHLIRSRSDEAWAVGTILVVRYLSPNFESHTNVTKVLLQSGRLRRLIEVSFQSSAVHVNPHT
jgi:hypothetical protein